MANVLVSTRDGNLSTYLKTLLEGEGHSVDVARGVGEAATAVFRKNYDLVLAEEVLEARTFQPEDFQDPEVRKAALITAITGQGTPIPLDRVKSIERDVVNRELGGDYGLLETARSKLLRLPTVLIMFEEQTVEVYGVRVTHRTTDMYRAMGRDVVSRPDRTTMPRRKDVLSATRRYIR